MSATIRSLAEQKEQALDIITALKMANTPATSEDRFKAAINYEIAERAYMAASRNFNEAIKLLSTEELIALVTQ